MAAVYTAIVQAICLIVGQVDRSNFNECLKTHTQEECKQIWRDK
jgi:hypothetical protein